MPNYIPETSSFSEAKKDSITTLDNITSLLQKSIKGCYDNETKEYSGYIDEEKTILSLDKALKELSYYIEELTEDEKTKAEDFKKNIEAVKQTLESTIKLNNAFVEMANTGAPLIEFSSIKEPIIVPIISPDNMDNLPYIELWGQTISGGLANLRDLNGNISLKGQYGNLDDDDGTSSDKNKCRFNIEIALKSNNDTWITKPTYSGSGTYNGNTVYLVIRGMSIKDSEGKDVDPKYYDFSMIEKTVKIVKIGNKLMARVNFAFNFPVGENRDKYLDYPENYFSLSQLLPPYSLKDIDTTDAQSISNFYNENGFWIYVVDNRNEYV